MRPMYTLSIDDDLAEDGKYLGVLEIANTATPAIKMTGIAFTKEVELTFKDDLKYRIAAPILMPSIIYRRDPETGEEYDVKVTPEVVEQMFVRFMRDRVGGDVFNVEHDESKRVPSYLLETWLVENPKQDKSFTTYGLECPVNTWFGVQQFTDKEAYEKAVELGQVGFSIHGDGVLKLSEIKKQNKMKKKKFVAQFADAVGTDSGEIIVTADELTEGAEVVVVDENFVPQEGFTGDVVINDETVKIEDDKIVSIGTEEVQAEEVIEEPVEMEEEKPEEVKEEEVEAAEETPAPETPSSETYTKEEVDAKFDELYNIIAELKAASPSMVEMEETPNVQMSESKSPLQLKMEKLEAMKNAKENMAKHKNK